LQFFGHYSKGASPGNWDGDAVSSEFDRRQTTPALDERAHRVMRRRAQRGVITMPFDGVDIG
jgi:hypothetical protein